MGLMQVSWGGFPPRYYSLRAMHVLLILTVAAGETSVAASAESSSFGQQRMEDPDGPSDSDCLKGFFKALTSTSKSNAAADDDEAAKGSCKGVQVLLSTWTPAALDSPCNRSIHLTGVTCSNMSRVASIRLPWAGLAGTLPSSISLCSSLTSLELPGNSLTGLIPSSLGDLPYLSTLCLAHSQLSGPIPVELATCFALSSLDLHSNQLSGSIPGQLGLLSLQHFNVSCNRLSGRIPSTLSNTSTGAPRFNASSFDHNPSLYGYPLSATRAAASSSHVEDNYRRTVYAVTFPIVGVIVVLLLVFMCCWMAHLYLAAQSHRRELVQREQQRLQRQNVGRQTHREPLEDGWKQVLTDASTSSEAAGLHH
ncbi:hypothetical protein L7F22_066509 [Adiantum nelumboides]|nr:hypothetical protein [Adiantum nelumboides]